MERFVSLKVEDSTYHTSKAIEQYLYTSDFYWLLDCEVDDVKIEIKDNILYFSGIFYWGVWKFGVFRSGEFRSGIWQGGIFLDGLFKGTFENGVWKGGIFKGKKISGEFPTEKI